MIEFRKAEDVINDLNKEKNNDLIQMSCLEIKDYCNNNIFRISFLHILLSIMHSKNF